MISMLREVIKEVKEDFYSKVDHQKAHEGSLH
jgi:hypothetical protein